MKKKNKLFKVLISIAACFGLVYAANRTINYLATKNRRLTSDPENFYNWKNGKVFYQVQGSGKPLVLLHNLSVISSAYEWSKVIGDLAKSHTVYTLDLPGCGRSGKDALTYTAFYYVQLIQDFLRDVVKEKADIAAVHTSAAITISAAIYNNKLIDQIVVITPPELKPFDSSVSYKNAFAAKLLKLPIIGTMLYNIYVCRSAVDLKLSEDIFYNPFDITAEVIDTCYEAAHLDNSNAKYLLASQIGGYMSLDQLTPLKKIKNKISVISGKKRYSYEEYVKAYCELNPDLTCIEIEDACQWPHFEQPGKFVAVLNSLLDGTYTEAADCDSIAKASSDSETEVNSEDIIVEGSETISVINNEAVFDE